MIKAEKKVVSVIIPVFNEEKTLAKVVRAVCQHPLVLETICVNDGSVDNSLEILKSFGNKIRLVNFKKNRGKGVVLAVGVSQAKGKIVVFIDSDLTGLKPEHLNLMLTSVLEGRAKAVLAIPTRNKKGRYDKLDLFMTGQYLTGQRVYFRKDLVNHLKRMAKAKHAVEIFLNSLFKVRDCRVIPLVGVSHHQKIVKWKPGYAAKGYWDLLFDTYFELLRCQFDKMKVAKMKSLAKTEYRQALKLILQNLVLGYNRKDKEQSIK